MREILFRGKRVYNGKWAYGDLSQRKDGRVYIRYWSTEIYSAFKVDPATVGQYTGLDDKNGVKIFEGDIVRIDYDIGDWGRTAKILFEDGEFRYRALTNANNLYNCRIYGENESCEVIGNIHDNPELLGA